MDLAVEGDVHVHEHGQKQHRCEKHQQQHHRCQKAIFVAAQIVEHINQAQMLRHHAHHVHAQVKLGAHQKHQNPTRSDKRQGRDKRIGLDFNQQLPTLWAVGTLGLPQRGQANPYATTWASHIVGRQVGNVEVALVTPPTLPNVPIDHYAACNAATTASPMAAQPTNVQPSS